jgi:hypothetical protein
MMILSVIYIFGMISGFLLNELMSDGGDDATK